MTTNWLWNPESARSVNGPVAPDRRTRLIITHETWTPATGVGRALSVADVEDLTGVSTGRHQGVLAEHFGVAVGGALFLLP